MKKLMNSVKMSKFDFINMATPIIDVIVPIKYSPNGTYTNKYFFTCLIDFVESSVHWTKYRGTVDFPIRGKYLNQIHNKYVKNNVYEEINKQLLNIYLKTDKEIKLKNQILDSSFVQNKGGSINNNNYLLSENTKQKNILIREQNKNLPENKHTREESFIDFNRYNGRKKYTKISSISDSLGTPLTSSIISSKQSDRISLIETLNKMPINLNTLRNSKVNRYKQFMLADSGYSSKKNKTYLKNLGYTPLILWNKGNTKDKKIIAENTFSVKEKKIYKKRIKIEHFFSWIKNYPVININYQKTITSYNGLLLLASSILISKRI